MSDKEALLAQLLGSLETEDLQRLLKMTQKDKEPEGPRMSKIIGSRVVLDNSEFEKVRDRLPGKIPFAEKAHLKTGEDENREAPPPREEIEKVYVGCHRCGQKDSVYPSEINSIVDGKAVYLCVKCSEKIRT